MWWARVGDSARIPKSRDPLQDIAHLQGQLKSPRLQGQTLLGFQRLG